MTNKIFFDRELSWISFNYRVLQEAKDPTVPLYEKIKFLYYHYYYVIMFISIYFAHAS